MRYITIALAKGRLAELSIELFEKIGIDCSDMKEDTRKLIFKDEANKLKFVLVKASDVPTYVEYGAADIGVAGRDTILEEGRNLYEMANLKFGACKMVVAGPVELHGKLDNIINKRVATKYPNIAKEYFQTKKGQTIDIIKLNGSVELADWSLNAGSYLIGKGVACSNLRDITGNSFANARAAGAYEYVETTAILEVQNERPQLISVFRNGFFTKESGIVDLFSLQGQLLKHENINEGQAVYCSAGMYICRVTTNEGSFIQKINIR